ncbi:MAG: 50S ribosomal protein L23 [Acidimicrobiia bacterium]|nr:50S ribosomal protein L23 [Acidimicrobiia bacterium]
MRKTTDVIRRPLVTEKTTVARDTGAGQVVVFEVAREATKVDIRRAVETLFGSKVAAVRTQIQHGKVKRQGRFSGQRPDWKKAWVRLKAGEKVPEFLEGA